MQQGLLQLLGKNQKIFLALVSTGGGGEENWENTNSDSWKQNCLSICGWGIKQVPASCQCSRSCSRFVLPGGKKKIKAINLKVLRWSWDRYVYYQQLIIAFLRCPHFYAKAMQAGGIAVRLGSDCPIVGGSHSVSLLSFNAPIRTAAPLLCSPDSPAFHRCPK